MTQAQSEKLCTNCNQGTQYSKGLCTKCYYYQLRHDGTARPRYLFDSEANVCRVCGSADVIAHRMCSACYKYQRKHGKDRPEHLWNDWTTCKNKNCDVSDGLRVSSGLCDRCHQFYLLTGEMMPAKYINNGWRCDCGKRARHTLDLKAGNKTYTYHLCDECYQLEVSPL